MSVVDVNVINTADALSTSIFDGKELVFVDTATSYSWRNIKATIEKANPKHVWFFLSHWDNDHYGNLFSAIEYCIDHDIHIKEIVLPTPPNNNKIQTQFNDILSKIIIKNYPKIQIEKPFEFNIEEFKMINDCLYKYLETANGLHNRKKSIINRLSELSNEGREYVINKISEFEKNGNKLEDYREAQLEIFMNSSNQNIKSLAIKEYLNPTIDNADKDKKLFKDVQMFDFEKGLRKKYREKGIKGLPKELVSTKITLINKPSEYQQKVFHISDNITVSLLRVNPELYSKNDKTKNQIDTKNNNSIIACLKIYDHVFYLPGDCETVLENAIEQVFGKGKALEFKELMEKTKVVVLAHHGLASATGYHALSHLDNARLGVSSIGRKNGDDSTVKERCHFKVLSTYDLDDIHFAVKENGIYVRSKEIHEQAKLDLKDEIVEQMKKDGDSRRDRIIKNSLPSDFNVLYELCKDKELKELTLGLNISEKIFDKDFLINDPERLENEAFVDKMIEIYNNKIDDLYE